MSALIYSNLSRVTLLVTESETAFPCAFIAHLLKLKTDRQWGATET